MGMAGNRTAVTWWPVLALELSSSATLPVNDTPSLGSEVQGEPGNEYDENSIV